MTVVVVYYVVSWNLLWIKQLGSELGCFYVFHMFSWIINPLYIRMRRNIKVCSCIMVKFTLEDRERQEHTGLAWMIDIIWMIGYNKYNETSNISCTLVGNKIVDHSDVVGALPVGTAPTTSSFSTLHLASIYCIKTTARRDEKQFSFGVPYMRDLMVSGSSLIQVMDCCLFGIKSLPEPMI